MFFLVPPPLFFLFFFNEKWESWAHLGQGKVGLRAPLLPRDPGTAPADPPQLQYQVPGYPRTPIVPWGPPVAHPGISIMDPHMSPWQVIAQDTALVTQSFTGGCPESPVGSGWG